MTRLEKYPMEIRNRRKITVVLFVLSIVIALSALCLGCGSEEGGDGLREIEGVHAADVNAKYDGTARRIKIENTEGADEVYYGTSESGPWSGDNPEYTVPGEYTVYYRIVRAGCKEYIGSAKITIERGILRNITAEDKTYVYDGEEHGIEINGTTEGQEVTYSTDGIKFEKELRLKEVGEYKVYYRVRDEYADYMDDCAVEILPNISGRYVNEKNGEIIITGTTVIENEKEYEMDYGITGRGMYNNKEFAVTDNVLEVDGTSYEKLRADESIYKINANDITQYVIGKEKIRITTEQTGSDTEIRIDERTEITVKDRNYVEWIKGTSVEREYTRNTTESEVRSRSEITEVEIELSKRGQLEFLIEEITAVYDGEKHGPRIEFDGEIIYETESGYRDPGKYTVRAILVPKSEYLPKVVETTVEIYPDITGVYCSGTEVMELTTESAKKNGECVSLGKADAEWTIDGERAEITENGIKVGDREYEKTTDGILVLKLFGERRIYMNVSNVVITTDGSNIDIIIDDEQVGCEADGGITVTVNGEGLNGIPSGDGSNEMLYILGVVELTDAVVFLDIRLAN